MRATLEREGLLGPMDLQAPTAAPDSEERREPEATTGTRARTARTGWTGSMENRAWQELKEPKELPVILETLETPVREETRA